MSAVQLQQPGKLPKATRGFEHINRYWDKHLHVAAAKILPGQFYVSTKGEMITTVLGSCVSACIRDKVVGVGGMNHFMLPTTSESKNTNVWKEDKNSKAMRYGLWAMEYLINEILKHGGQKQRLEVKLFGGGKILKTMTDIGQRNIVFVIEFLARENLDIIAQDLGDTCPRKVVYFSDSGKVRVKRLRSIHNTTIEERELEYSRELVSSPDTGGDVELF